MLQGQALVTAKYTPIIIFLINSVIILNKNYIIQRTKEAKSIKEFILLLNEFKKEKYGFMCIPYRKGTLCYYTSCRTPIENLYKEVYIDKKSGKKRRILIPTKQLKEIQQFIKCILEALYTPGDSVTGFVKGKSIVDNAKPHIGRKYIFCYDIKNFFSSTYASRVKQRLLEPPFNFTDEIANLITNLCCVRISNSSKHRVLPQGAPTSPILSNAVFESVDKYILKHFPQVTYTRYADDLTFSADQDVFYYRHRRGYGFRRQLINYVLPYPYYVNKLKTRTLKKGQRQIVTGIVVNTKLNVKREYLREIRSLLYIWENYGYTTAQKRLILFRKKTNSPTGELINVLRGKLNFLKQVRGSNDSKYQDFMNRFKSLLFYHTNIKLVILKLESGLTIKGRVISLNLNKEIRIEVLGRIQTCKMNQIKEICEVE